MIMMKSAYAKLIGVSVVMIGVAGCQPQQTNIITEITRPDGTITKYVNTSSGYFYNPNATMNVNVGGYGHGVREIYEAGWGGYGYGGMQGMGVPQYAPGFGGPGYGNGR